MVITYKGVTSTTYSLKVRTRPVIPRAEKNVEKIEIPGRHGYLAIDYNNYKPITIPVEFLFTGTDVPTNARNIKKWLTDSGNLVFSDDPNVYYKAAAYSAFDIESAIKNYGAFIVNFDCQPFAYATDNTVTHTTSPQTFTNPGYYSEPYIKVNGSGNITLTINGANIILSNVVSYIELDSEMLNCYKGTAAANNQMTGEFPILVPGSNTISWTGTVTSVNINYRWRYL